MIRQQKNRVTASNWRRKFVLGVLMLGMSGLVFRAGWLQLKQDPRLINKLSIQHLETVKQSVARGRILDRRGEILASSAPIRSIGIDRKIFSSNKQSLELLGKAIKMPVARLRRVIDRKTSARYISIKRRVAPSEAREVAKLGLKGVVIDRHYDRYYPGGEASAHLVGFVGRNGHGQEGVEQVFDKQLFSTPGSYSVLRDRKRHKLEVIQQLHKPENGDDIVLSIDQRLQYIAYRELKSALSRHQAKAASFVMLDIHTGEILAMVNLPDFNPNNRNDRNPADYRNRVVTDLFEPGSTIKPFTIGCALQAGIIDPDTEIDTTPGYIKVGRNRVRDMHNYKLLDVSGVMRKSSNVGIAKIALALEPKTLWDCYHRAKFDQKVSADFPGLVAGHLPAYEGWGQFEQATHAFGYGINTSLLQLTHAYTAWGNQGAVPALSLLKRNQAAQYERVFTHQTAKQILQLMETVVSTEGTASKAQISGYRVAGKTGTVQKITEQGYSPDNHLGLFVGIVPVSNPRFVAAVLIDDPQQGDYFGGVVAAPVFSNVMKQALRIYAVPPDDAQTDNIVRLAYSTVLDNVITE